MVFEDETKYNNQKKFVIENSTIIESASIDMSISNIKHLLNKSNLRIHSWNENYNEIVFTENNKEKINKKLANLLELNLEGRINKEQYTLKFDELNTELIKIDNKIEVLLKETNRTESIKQRLNKFKSLFKDIEIMPKFDKDVFECLVDKVIIGETQDDGTINPYTIRFICKNGSEINCKDRFTNVSDKQAIKNTATSDKQHSNNTATRENQHMLSAYLFLN